MSPKTAIVQVCEIGRDEVPSKAKIAERATAQMIGSQNFLEEFAIAGCYSRFQRGGKRTVSKACTAEDAEKTEVARKA